MPPELFLFEGTPTVQAFPETYASDLSVLLRLYGYVAVVKRYDAAAQVITGAGYPINPTV